MFDLNESGSYNDENPDGDNINGGDADDSKISAASLYSQYHHLQSNSESQLQQQHQQVDAATTIQFADDIDEEIVRDTSASSINAVNSTPAARKMEEVGE